MKNLYETIFLVRMAMTQAVCYLLYILIHKRKAALNVGYRVNELSVESQNG